MPKASSNFYESLVFGGQFSFCGFNLSVGRIKFGGVVILSEQNFSSYLR
jgi:hypothetical protein